MKKLLLYTIVLIFSLSQCKQTEVAPVPSGTIEIVPMGRGQIKVICNATNADSFVWEFGDNSPNIYGANLAHQYEKNGTYIITVTITGKGGTNKVSKGINITDVLGAVTFWIQSGSYQINVNVDGRNMGTITSKYSSQPDCGASGTAWSGYSFAPGTYRFSASEVRNNPAMWSGTVTIYANQCTKMQLTQ